MTSRCFRQVKSIARQCVSDITLRRVGAVGDAVWATSLFDALSKRAHAQGGGLYFSTGAPHSLFENDNRLAGVLDKSEHRGQLIDLTDAYEKRPTIHPIAAYAEAANVPLIEATAPKIQAPPVQPAELVYVHPAISWENRTLPRAFWLSVISSIIHAGKTVAVVGTKQETSMFTDYSTLTCSLDHLARYMVNGVFVGSDSGPLQIAAAIGIPCVGLYTCASGRLRVPRMNLERFVAIDTAANCRGCLHRAPAPVRFYDCDHTDEKRHQCLQMIDPVAVADHAIRLVNLSQSGQ